MDFSCWYSSRTLRYSKHFFIASLSTFGRANVQRLESDKDAIGSTLLLSRHGEKTIATTNYCFILAIAIGTRYGTNRYTGLDTSTV
jgi:hypothetical protein